MERDVHVQLRKTSMSSEMEGAAPTKGWAAVIGSVQAPIQLLALVALIVLAALTMIAARIREWDRSILVVSLLLILSFIVVFAAKMARGWKSVRRPGAGTNAQEGNGATLPRPPCLQHRRNLGSFEDEARDATEIVAIGVSLISIMPAYTHFLRAKLEHGCKLRFVLLDPASEAIRMWEALGYRLTKHEIRSTLADLFEMMKSVDQRGARCDCEVRLSPTLLPFSLIAIDPSKPTGKLIVEFYAYKTSLGERPHVTLTAENKGTWFGFYCDQLEKVWNDSVAIRAGPKRVAKVSLR